MSDMQKFLTEKYINIANNKSKRICCLTDSLSMPRPEESLPYEDTYPFLLEKLLNSEYEVLNRGKRANTILEQSTEQNIYDDFICFNPKFVIIHIGIVDSAPRIFSRRVGKLIIGNLKPLVFRKFVIKQFSKNRLFFTKYFPKHYVKLDEFYFYYNYLVDTIIQFGSTPIVVNIAKTSTTNNQRSYKFNEHIINYNSKISVIAKKNNIELIDMYSVSEKSDILLTDGIHINKNGSAVLADLLFESINKIQDSNNG